MRMRLSLVCLAGWLGCTNPRTDSPANDGSSLTDAAPDAGDLAQPMAPCLAAQGLTGTPLSGLCVDMDTQPAPDLSSWKLSSQTAACSSGWALAGSGPGAVLRPVNYTPSAGTNVGCGFRFRELTQTDWNQKTRLRIAIEYVYQPGLPVANSYAVIELIGAAAPTLFYPTSTTQPARAVFDVDVARLPPASNVPIEFRLWQSSNLTAAPKWDIRSLAVLVE